MQRDFMTAKRRKSNLYGEYYQVNMPSCARFYPQKNDVRINTRKKAGVDHMSNNRKRKDPMPWLIVVAVLMALLVVAAVIFSEKISDYRADKLKQLVMEAEQRNQDRYSDYLQEVENYKAEMQQGTQVNKAWPAAKQEGWDVIDLTNYPLEAAGTVTVNRADIMNNGLLLVNPWHSRPEDFSDEKVVSVSGYARGDVEKELGSFWEDSSCELLPNAIDAIVEMLRDAKAVGLEHFVLKAGSTYRTYEDQKSRFDKEVERQRSRHSNYSEERLIEAAKENVNYPGTSEFNTGLAFEFYFYDGTDRERKLANTPFYETEQGKWLYENSWKYGIVFRFPQDGYPMADTVDKAYKTGVNRNLNFYRYVGVGNATVMHHLDLCLEEYIEYLMDHPHIAVFENGQKKYEITRQQVGDDVASFSVTINRMTNNYTMYLDNMGGVVTVYSY